MVHHLALTLDSWNEAAFFHLNHKRINIPINFVAALNTYGTLDATAVGDLATTSPGGAIFPVHILQLRSNK